jgi:dTDP-4-dehydrorhamnose reductase
MNDRRRILVTGASGLLGRSLAKCLEDQGTVTGVGHSNPTGSLVSADLREADVLESLLMDSRPDVVVHSAAYRDPDFCEAHPEEARRLNLVPVEHLCEILPESVPLLFISSDYVFDGGAAPYDEGDGRHPVNEYGRLKVTAEDLVLRRDKGLVLRIPLLIGAGPTWEASGFIYKTLARIQDPSPSSLDDTGVRFPTWTEDVAYAASHLLRTGTEGAYHYSALEGGTKYQWAQKLADLTGLAMDHIVPDREGSSTRAARPGDTQLAMDKIRRTGLDRFTPFRQVAASVLRRFPPLGNTR